MTRAKLELHFDRNNKINKFEIHRTGGATLEDTLGEIHASWNMRPKEEIVETLMKVCEIVRRTCSVSA